MKVTSTLNFDLCLSRLNFLNFSANCVIVETIIIPKFSEG